jgi:8-oxo-dGTP pyrophosphatase MutT (NUDIX family)
MAITDTDLTAVLARYLDRYPDDAPLLEEPAQALANGGSFASRAVYPMHVTVGALVVCGDSVLLVNHRAYSLLLQPGGHLEPTDQTLLAAALRELCEETGIDPGSVRPVSGDPVYVEYGPVPARPEKGELRHYHLDFGFAFTAETQVVGDIQQEEVTHAAWYPLGQAEQLVGTRIARAAQAARTR